MSDFLKNQDALPVETVAPNEAFLVVAEYDHSSDSTVALTNALAAIEERLLIFDTTWDDDNGGLFESTTSTGIASVAAGDGATKHPAGTGYTEVATDIVITPARAWEETNENPHNIWPIVLFNDEPVPFTRIKKIGDGFTTGDLVIIVDNTSGDYNTTATNWKLILTRPFPGIIEMDLGGKPLPQTSESKRLLGYTDPATTRTINDGGPGSGSFTAALQRGRLEVANGRGAAGTRELLNSPGEDIYKELYGALWTAGALNEVGYQSSGKRLVMAQCFWGGQPLLHAAATERNKVFLQVILHVGVRVTEIANVGNVSADSTDFLPVQVNVEWDSLHVKVFKTAS